MCDVEVLGGLSANTYIMTKKKKVRYGTWQEETKRHGLCWRYDVRVLDFDGKLKRRTGSGFATKAECDTAVAKLTLESRENRYGLARPKPPKIIIIKEIAENYITALTGRWRARHGQEYVQKNIGQTNAIRTWVEFIGEDKNILKLKKQDLILWSHNEMERGLAASSVKRRYNSIRAALNYGCETFDELKNFNVPKISFGKDATQGRIRTLNEEEITQLAKVLRSKKKWHDAYDFFRIALGSGGRFDEIFPVVVRKDHKKSTIKWTDIDKRKETTNLFSWKTKKLRTLRVPGVVDILRERKKNKLGNSIYAFDCRDHYIRKVFEIASKECGIPYGQKTPNGWTPHDLRHTCLTNLLQSGVDLATVRDFAGHHSITETSKYVHSTEESLAKLAKASSKLIEII